MAAMHGLEPADGEDVELALTVLHPRSRRLALRRLVLARANRTRTGDVGAVDHAVASLLLTARMERTPGYAETCAAGSPSMVAMDVADVVAALEAHHRDPAT